MDERDAPHESETGSRLSEPRGRAALVRSDARAKLRALRAERRRQRARRAPRGSSAARPEAQAPAPLEAPSAEVWTSAETSELERAPETPEARPRKSSSDGSDGFASFEAAELASQAPEWGEAEIAETISKVSPIELDVSCPASSDVGTDDCDDDGEAVTAPCGTLDERADGDPAHSSDLHRLPGAGPGLVWILQRAGIETLGQLAVADAASLAGRLGLIGELLDLPAWIAEASRLAGDGGPA